MRLILRTFILYIVVTTALRLMGKRQLGELQPSELVVAIMISDLAAVPMQSTDIPLIAGIIPVATLLVLEVIVSFATLKSGMFRKFISGEPSVVIYDGKILEKEMRRVRVNLSDLLEELRLVNCYDISDVQVAVIETSGKLSVIPKDNARALTVEDYTKNKTRREGLPCTIIADGRLNKRELQRAGWDEKRLLKELKKQNIERVEDTFIASLDAEGSLFAQRKGEECQRVRGIF